MSDKQSNIKVYKDELKTKQLQVYEQYKDIIALVFVVGNKVALQMQVTNILLQYKNNKYKDENAVYKAVDRLEEADLIEKKNYKNLNLIVLRNPAIKWFMKEFNDKTDKKILNSQSVGKKITDGRLDISLFKMEYFSRCVEKNALIDDLYNLFKNNSLPYRKEHGLDMLVEFVFHNINDKQYKEFNKYANELKNKRVEKLATVPDRNGKTKEYVENKRASFQTGTANVKQAKKKEKSSKYNFNSVLNTKNLILELNKYDTYDEDNGYGKMIPQYKLYFNLFILDINDSLNYNVIGDMTRKTYLMLREMFGRETALITKNEKCRNCPYNVANKEMFKKLKSVKHDAQRCYPGTNAQRIGCKEFFQMLQREVYLNVTYIGWNSKREEEVKLNCNKVSYDNAGLRDYHNLKHRVVAQDKNLIEPREFDEYITINFENFNIDRFTTRKGNQNLEEYNRNKQQNAVLKEELKENEETVRFLKDLKNVLEEENLELEDLKYLMRAIKKEKEKEEF